MKFKVGDKVLLTESNTMFNEGDVVEIKMVDTEDEDYPYLITNGNSALWVHSSEIEKVVERTPGFHCGDKVRIVDARVLCGHKAGEIATVINPDNPRSTVLLFANGDRQRINIKYIRHVSDNFRTITITIDGNKTIAEDSDGKQGMARCHPDDTFDLQTGVALALDRMENGWKPVQGEMFFTVCADGAVASTTSTLESSMAEYGNYFRTEEAAKKAAEKIKKLLKDIEHE